MCFGGGGSVNSQFDPQVGEAAKMNAETARQSLDFTKSYFADTLVPLQRAAEERAKRFEGMAVEDYNLNKERSQLFDSRYREFGIPAEDRYFAMARDFSTPEEEERQAIAAQGDVINASQVQRANLARQLAAAGIDPTSPAAVAAATDASVMTAAAQASAANKARSAARTLGMQLTSDAANYGRGMPSGVLSFGNAASGNAAQGFAYGNAPMGSALASGNFVQQGYRGANAAYGQNLAAYTSLANTDRQTQAQMESANAAGMGQAIGSMVGLGLGAYTAFRPR